MPTASADAVLHISQAAAVRDLHEALLIYTSYMRSRRRPEPSRGSALSSRYFRRRMNVQKAGAIAGFEPLRGKGNVARMLGPSMQTSKSGRATPSNAESAASIDILMTQSLGTGHRR
jgi:hypothetical protein